MKRFIDKIALVTGAASGIGRATVSRLCEEGAKVILADINLQSSQEFADSLKNAGYIADAIYFNATDVNSCKDIVNEVISSYGTIDVLINVVGGNNLNKDLAIKDVDIEYFDELFHINLRSMLVTIQTVLPNMQKNKKGSIVNVSSIGGITGDYRGSLYGMSKAGVINLTQYVATQYGKDGIRCNAVAPGLILTPAALSNLSDETRNIFLKNNSLPYLGEPSHIASTIAFLASSDADYITGQTIIVDGGLTSHNPTVGDLR